MKNLLLLMAVLLLTACPEKEAEQKHTEKQLPNTETAQVACSKELKICPDGSGVGRNAEKKCAFDACPESISEQISTKKGEMMMCTQDVKQCPDGSYVGRDAYKQCAFKPCPEGGSNLQ